MLVHREGSDLLTRCDRGQPSCLLTLIAGFRNRLSGDAGREERQREQVTTGFFEQHHEVQPGEPGAPVRLRDRQAGPA